MEKFGVLASVDERPKLDKKWWQFWKVPRDYDTYTIGDLCELWVVYMPETCSRHSDRHHQDDDVTFSPHHLAQVEAFFTGHGIIDLRKFNGDKLLENIYPEIIRRNAKKMGKDTRMCSLAIVEDDNTKAREYLRQYAKKFREITWITKNVNAARATADALFAEFGLFINIVSEAPKTDFCVPFEVNVDSNIEIPSYVPKLPFLEALWSRKIIRIEDLKFESCT